MMKRIPLFSILLLLLVWTSFCHAEDNESISGQIITGFRVLSLDPADKNASFTVYRGDYIKFSYPQEFASLPFSVPALKYKDTLMPDPTKSPFFKMKATGTYPFSLGPVSGSIKVIDLVRVNYTEVTAEQASEILHNLNPFILDVRTPQEHRQLHLAGSHLIPIQELQARVGELDSKKDDDIFIYCATGNRSTVAARILADRGFKRIYNLRYGIHDWARRGYPFNKP